MIDPSTDPSAVPPAVDAASAIWREGAVRHTILVIEDNDDHRYVYTRVLRLAGYQVLEAGDGEQGLREARRASPSLVVVDLGLPKLDGWQVIEELKGDAATRDIPLIVVSVHSFPDDVERAGTLGCALHLPKPHAPLDLVGAVHLTLGLA